MPQRPVGTFCQYADPASRDPRAGSVRIDGRELTGLRADVLARADVGVLLVEQDLRLAFTVASEVRVMQNGRLVHSATVHDFRRDRVTARRLLGVG